MNEIKTKRMSKKKLNNTEYHRKYLDFLWVLYAKTYPTACKFNLSQECKDNSIDKRIIKVLFSEKTLWKNKGSYLWTGNLPDVKLAERTVRQMRLSRKKHLKTGIQQVKGYKKGAFSESEKNTFVELLRHGYKYGYISTKLNRQTALLRKYKHRLKKKGYDISPVQLKYEEQFKNFKTADPLGEEGIICKPKAGQLRLLP